MDKAVFQLILRKLKIGNLIYLYEKIRNKSESILSEEEALAIITQDYKYKYISCIKEDTRQKEAKYDLDVIVPVYNVERYLDDCLKSICNQKTKYNIRILCINDGSKDQSILILNEWKKKDDRIIVIDQKNQGLSAARNRGLDLLESKYVMFVDSDDLVTDQSIDKLMDAAYLYQADIVEGAYESFNNKGKITYQFKQKSGRLTKNQIQGFAWGKVYKSELFLNLRFPVGYWFEDTIMRFYLYHIVSNIIGIEHCVYRYRKNTNGITHSANKSRKSIDTLFVYLDVYHDFSKLNIEYDLSDYEALLNHIKLSCLRTIGLTKNEKFAIFSFWCHYLDEHYTSYHTLNPYLIPFEQMLRHRRYKQYLYYSYFK